MESQTLINWSFGVAAAILGWIGRTLWDAVASLRTDLHALETELPKTYAAKIDLEARFDRIDEALRRLYDKLDGKADK